MMLSRRVFLVSFVAVACAPARSPDASVVAVERVAVDVPRSEPPNPRARLAGPGTTLDIDELRAVAADARIRDQDVPYGERVELAQQRLGVSGEPMRDPVGEGTRFVGIGGANHRGPWSCYELLVLRPSGPGTGWLLRQADHPRCGLPYLTAPPSSERPNEPSLTVTKLREAAAVGHVADLLGPPSREQPVKTWFAIGPRGREAPITCHALTLRGAEPFVNEVPLTDCGYFWPPPPEDFDPGAVPVIDRAAARAECATRCGANEVCVVHQHVPEGARIRDDADGPRAHLLDGKPVPVEITTSCTTTPPPKTALGPCSKEAFLAYHYEANERPPYAVCSSRAGPPARRSPSSAPSRAPAPP